jgi:hypothetical protein
MRFFESFAGFLIAFTVKQHRENKAQELIVLDASGEPVGEHELNELTETYAP